MTDFTFRIAAKTDVGLQRTNNEDSLQVSANLDKIPMTWLGNQVVKLSNRGTLLVVADGMGGMNAGEVASAVAINTVKDWFRPENITDDVVKNRYSIEKFMNDCIVKADANIKLYASAHPESSGMGTTIVIGWIFDRKLYVSWCGDSRAYIFNPQSGLHQITVDHSYVQDLVDKGALTRDEAFDFPDSNIITRSLSDAAPKAKPESLVQPIPLTDGDIVMLCTDGLCGMIRDNEIEDIIRSHTDNMIQCVDALIDAACNAAGADNITICLCQIISGGLTRTNNAFTKTESRLNGPNVQTETTERNKRPFIKWIIICITIIILATVAILLLRPKNKVPAENTPKADNTPDTTLVEHQPSEETTSSNVGQEGSQTVNSSPKGGSIKPKASSTTVEGDTTRKGKGISLIQKFNNNDEKKGVEIKDQPNPLSNNPSQGLPFM